jgi:molybdopterin molybdotransferase
MPEFLTLLPPDLAREKLLSSLPPLGLSTVIETATALGRVTSQDVLAPHPLPAFPRSTVDGFAVQAHDTFGASDSLPAYLKLIGEVPMGDAPGFELQAGQTAIIHTGGMLPSGADAVMMLEYTQTIDAEIEMFKAIAIGENIIRIGEDVAEGQIVIPRGARLRPAEIGGLMALGYESVRVANKVRVAIISSGDEIVPPNQAPRPGQVRDVNAYTLATLVAQTGGEPVLYGIIPDDFDALKDRAAQALADSDVVLITAGSSASIRDMTADVINALGQPGVLVHGINTRPGKPTILGVCNGKAVIGLPGNPVSALTNGYMMVVPLIEKLLGLPTAKPRPTVRARLTVNLASQAGREDWQPVQLSSFDSSDGSNWQADPVFGKSNLIFTLANAIGLIRIPTQATGLPAGEIVEVVLM